MNSRDLMGDAGPGGVPAYGRSSGPTLHERLMTALTGSSPESPWLTNTDRLSDLDPDGLEVLMAGARAVSSQAPLFRTESPQVVCISGHVDGVRLPLMVLTAWLLCVSGVQAIITAPRRGQGPLNAGDILAVMGVPPIDRSSASRLLAGRGEPAFLPLDVLNGALESWFDPRASDTQQRLAHLLAPLIGPVMPPASCRVLFADEPATVRTWVALACERGINALVMSMDGPQAVVVAHGKERTLVPEGGWSAETTVGPQALDAVGIARWVQSVLAGEFPVPGVVTQMVDAVLALSAQSVMRDTEPAES